MIAESFLSYMFLNLPSVFYTKTNKLLSLWNCLCAENVQIKSKFSKLIILNIKVFFFTVPSPPSCLMIKLMKDFPPSHFPPHRLLTGLLYHEIKTRDTGSYTKKFYEHPSQGESSFPLLCGKSNVSATYVLLLYFLAKK